MGLDGKCGELVGWNNGHLLAQVKPRFYVISLDHSTSDSISNNKLKIAFPTRSALHKPISAFNFPTIWPFQDLRKHS